MRKVSKAALYGDMGSLGNASNKLIRQFCFPYEYEELERMLQADHDRMYEFNYDRTLAVFRKHTIDASLPYWCLHASDDEVLALLKDLFDVDEDYPNVQWTGYRITGTVNKSSGYPVYSLWLFAKRPDSKTKVYTGTKAPNVDPGSVNNNYGYINR